MVDPVNNLAEKLETTEATVKPQLTAIEGGLKDEIVDPLDVVTFRKTKRQHIREFGNIIALACVLFAAYKLYKGGSLELVLALTASGSLFALICAIAPRTMIPVLQAWMWIGHILEITTTWMILGGMWFVTFFPIGLIFKLIGKTPMTLGFEPDRKSYWEDCHKDRTNFQLLERQY